MLPVRIAVRGGRVLAFVTPSTSPRARAQLRKAGFRPDPECPPCPHPIWYSDLDGLFGLDCTTGLPPGPPWSWGADFEGPEAE